MLRRPALAALLCAALLATPAAAHAAEPGKYPRDLSSGPNQAPDDAIPVRPALPPVPEHATGHGPDLGLELSPARARAAKRLYARAAKEQTFSDPHGHRIRIAGENDAVDLQQFASILASAYHFDEMDDLFVIVTSARRVASICGSDQAVACYGPTDPDSSSEGTMVLSYEDADIVHTTFHEYGHHMDNQLYNLDERIGCRFDNDGSRRWFFTRDLETRILDNTTCDPDADWESLLGELYAEDYAQLSAVVNGIALPFDSRMPAGPPSGTILVALQRDIDRPFVPRTRTYKGSFRRRTVRRKVNLDAPAFVRLTGASEVRRARLTGCSTAYDEVYAGRCKLSLTRKGGARRYRVGLQVF